MNVDLPVRKRKTAFKGALLHTGTDTVSYQIKKNNLQKFLQGFILGLVIFFKNSLRIPRSILKVINERLRLHMKSHMKTSYETYM